MAFPSLPGVAVMSGGGIGGLVACGCIAALLLLFIDRTRELLADTIWYRWVVGYFLVTTLVLAAIQTHKFFGVALLIWIVGSLAVIGVQGDRWVAAVREKQP